MNRKIVIILALIIGISSSIFAQTPDEMVAKFFETYKKKEPIKALDDIYAKTPWLESIKANIDNLKVSYKELNTILGDYNGYELLYQKDVKGSFMLATYLVKFDRQPVRFNFQFYKPEDQWVLYYFYFDYDLEKDLQESMKKEMF